MAVESSIVKSLSTRHSEYALTETSPLSNEEVADLIKQVTEQIPSSFNGQSQRVVVLFGDASKKLWDITLKALRGVVPEDQPFESTEQKMAGFASGQGTVLFFDNSEVTNAFAEKFSAYAENFPTWAQQANGMLQISVWTALSEAGLGGSLQHYNPLIDLAVAEEFDIPGTWRLIAQMPFGGVSARAQAKDKLPIDERVKVIGL
ncbi:nitroreductase family protein [Bifidobacterium crudilactis]|jgi:predicted oxidoreductase (fatty acid repression mutant protein)|uniref:Nitroreductase family protein n=1 Tax=Bifidobacterium crudilactis TaxID=327277 RepID=A0A971D0D5_9BIFI|nr:nitroreductase family protein [Bifidobacterium crudilactis]MCI1869108.1 nitroreductase family protein [Bifidobacterium crudilactis]NLT80443.1 nitroreductase family protein [Bifidobacterium crudilactis]